MFEKIMNFGNLSKVYKLLMNTRLAIRTDEADVDVVWLGYNLVDRMLTFPQFNSGLHRHSFYEMHLCLSGHCMYLVRDQQYAIAPGQMILIAAEEAHFQLQKSPDCSKIALGFSIIPKPDDLSGKLIGALSQAPALFSDRTEEIADMFYAILEEFSSQKLGYIAATNALLLRIILSLARLCGEEGAQPDFSLRVDQRISEINAIIQSRLDSRVTCQEIASLIHLSVRQINRIIQNEYGMSLSAYIERVKCAQAKNILLYTDTPICKIAGTLGYTSEFSFNKFFKRVEGMPPGRFRRSRFAACAKGMLNDE